MKPEYRRRPVFVTGFMATGKSKVGRLLARQLDRIFLDTDELVDLIGRAIADEPPATLTDGGLIREPIENSSSVRIKRCCGGVSGVVIPPQPTRGIGLDHRTDRFTAVEDLRSGHHVAIAR